MSITILPRTAIVNDPGKLGALSETGQLRIMPASFYANFTNEEIMAFCVLNGFYCLPTEELLAWLRSAIGTKCAMEVGAGNGVLAAALGIRATDNRMQDWPAVAAHYRAIRQATVRYGANVEELDANAAVEKYTPDVAVACWVTHLYRPEEHGRGGNMFGVDEEALLSRCGSYIHVGHSRLHASKRIRSIPHRTYRIPGLVARTMTPDLAEISVWGARLPIEPPAP